MTLPSADAPPTRPIEVFYSYSHKDEGLRDELETHLSILRRRGVISSWHDRRIFGGVEWGDQISEHLNKADLILLLVSADFLASDYCQKELDRAMARHQLREARVIPIILRDCDWDFTSFSKLQALPRDGRPVTAWASRDEAFKNVAVGIRAAAEELARTPSKPWKERQTRSGQGLAPLVKPRTYVSPIRSPRDLRLHGPRLKVMIGPPILRRSPASPSGGPEISSRAKFLETDALLDTGASRTLVTPEVVRRAGLSKINEAEIRGVGGVVKADVYVASLQFPKCGLRTIEVIEVSCCGLSNILYHCLLGRDVLSRWVLAYDGSVGTWSIKEEDDGPWVESEGVDPGPWNT